VERVPARQCHRRVRLLGDGRPDPADIGASGVILLYPLRRPALSMPLLRVPDEDLICLFSLLRTAAPDSGALSAAAMLAANRALYEQVRGLGGYQYPIGSIPTTRADWRAHFGSAWPLLARARRRYDPRGILTPGPGIFPSPPGARSLAGSG